MSIWLKLQLICIIDYFSGLGHHIGALTVKSILDTLSNNDYVNIMNYTDKTNYLVPCFQEMLVQATKENIQLFSEAVDSLDPEGKTQLGQALEVAFNLLAKVNLLIFIMFITYFYLPEPYKSYKYSN